MSTGASRHGPGWVSWLLIAGYLGVLAGRDGSVRDVLTNSTGAAIGVALYRLVARRPQPVRQQ